MNISTFRWTRVANINAPMSPNHNASVCPTRYGAAMPSSQKIRLPTVEDISVKVGATLGMGLLSVLAMLAGDSEARGC